MSASNDCTLGSGRLTKKRGIDWIQKRRESVDGHPFQSARSFAATSMLTLPVSAPLSPVGRAGSTSYVNYATPRSACRPPTLGSAQFAKAMQDSPCIEQLLSRIRFADAQRLGDLPMGPALQVVQEHDFPLCFVEDE